MEVRSIQYMLKGARRLITDIVFLPVDAKESFSRCFQENKNTVFLLSHKDIGQILKFDDLIADLDTKNPDIELYRTLTVKTEKIPFVSAGYKVAGKIDAGIKKFLVRLWDRNTELNQDRSRSYLVAVSDENFKCLIQKHGSNPETTTPMTPGNICGLQAQPDSRWLERQLVGHSQKIRSVRNQILNAAYHDEPVLLLGESGTGKSKAAMLIHKLSNRHRFPFATVACGAIVGTLFESELFGHKKDTFHGAKDRKGLWRDAENGTLFIDEIGELPPEQQVKLLDVLQRRVVRPVGSDKEFPVSARLIFATNCDLNAMVRNHTFREDLYWRIRGVTIHMPALREMLDSIPEIANAVWAKITEGSNCQRLCKEIIDKLSGSSWPGNFRALVQVLKSLYYNDINKREKTLEDLNTVLAMIHEPNISGPAVAENEVDLHKAKCLRHLKEAEEWVRSCLTLFEPFCRTDSRLEGLSPPVLESRIEQLDRLISEPLLFFSREVFDDMEKIKTGINDFVSLLDEGFSLKARNFLCHELNNTLFQTQKVLFAGVQDLIK